MSNQKNDLQQGFDRWWETAQKVTEGRFFDAYRAGFDDGAKYPRPLVYGEIEQERRHQDRQWGGPEHDDQHSQWEWLRFIEHQVSRARAAADIGDTGFASDPDAYRARLVKIAALAVAAIESHDRQEDR